MLERGISSPGVSSEEEGKTKTSLIGEGSWLGIETVEPYHSQETSRGLKMEEGLIRV